MILLQNTKKSVRATARSGQAMLVSILMVTAAALAIGVAVATISSSEISLQVAAKDSSRAYVMAESCLKDSLMHFARTDKTTLPNLTIEQDSCTISVVGTGPYTITSTGRAGKAWRKIVAIVSVDVEDVVTVNSYGERY